MELNVPDAVQQIPGDFSPGITLARFTRTTAEEAAPAHSWESLDTSIYSVRATPDLENYTAPAAPALFETFAVDFVHSDLKVTSVARRITLNNELKADGKMVGGIPRVFIMNWVLPRYDPPNPLWGADQTNGEGYNIIIYAKLAANIQQAIEKALADGWDMSFWAATLGLDDAALLAAATAEAALMFPPLREPANPDAQSLIGSPFSWGGGAAAADDEATVAARKRYEQWKDLSAKREARRVEYITAFTAKARLPVPAGLPNALALIHRIVNGRRSAYNMRNRAVNLLQPTLPVPLVTAAGVEAIYHGDDGDDEMMDAAEALQAEREDAEDKANLNWAMARMRIVTRICNLDACQFNAVVKPLAEKYNGCPYFVADCQRLETTGPVFEASIDVHQFSYLSKLGLAACRDILTVLIFDVLLVAQGSLAAELPEVPTLGVRINQMRLEGAPNITSERDRELSAMMSPKSPE